MRVPSNVVTFPTATTSVDSLLNCDQFIGYLAVYPVCMGVALFLFIMMLLMVPYCFKSFQKALFHIQNGLAICTSKRCLIVSRDFLYRLWVIKWIVVIVVIVSLFFIPDGQNLVFSKSGW